MNTKVVPHSFLKKEEYAKKLEELKKQQEKELKELKEKNKEYSDKKTGELKTLYKTKELEEKENEKIASSKNSFYVRKDPEFLLVLRVRGINRVPPKYRKILDILRVRKINTAVLVKNNEPTRAMLQKVRNYIAWGSIDISLLRDLIYKRGMCKINNRIQNLTNENIAEYFMGNIRCIEEIVYTIFYGTESFKEVNRFLAPFHLSCPVGGFKGRKALDFVEGGSCGNHFEKIGDLVSRMID